VATIVIPLYESVVFVRLLNGSEFSGWNSEIAQTLDTVTWIKCRAGCGGTGERRPLGSVRISRCSGSG
jgi:hypothetical protein